MAVVYLGLGANLGDRRANLTRALALLPPLVRVEAVSALYESAPQPPSPPPDYLNAACRAQTDLSPLDLLRYLKGIEERLGRRPAERWSARPIDLDILLYDDQVLETPELQVPHPRIEERNFVLRPLLDLDAGLRHPVTRERLDAVIERVGTEGLSEIAAVGWENR